MKSQIETAHTTGEWLLDKDYSVSSSKLWERVLIAQICSANNNDEEKAANAKLIAAAPKLLIELQNLVRSIEEYAEFAKVCSAGLYHAKIAIEDAVTYKIEDEDDDIERNEFGDELVVGCARCGNDVHSTNSDGLCKKCAK
jgi:hypothetical protein